MKKEKVILVGCNHAGTSAANILLEHKDKVELTIYERNWNTSFLACGMALWIGNQITKPEGLFYSSKDILEQKGANIFLESEVYNIDYDNKKVYVRFKDGKETVDTYDKLILALGSTPIVPNFLGKDLENIQIAKRFQDAQMAFSKNNDKNIKKVTIVGAGYIGVELAEAFQRAGKEVMLIDLADRILASHFDKEFSAPLQELLDKNKIITKLNEKVCSFEGKDNKVKYIITDKGKYETDLVILCIGFRANNELAKDKLELFNNNAIKVNLKNQTSNKDVYAIGDCATVYNNSINNYDYIALATNAVRSGIICASNILGRNVNSNGVQGSSGLCVYDLKMVSTGLTLESAKKHNIEVLHTDFEANQKPQFMSEKEENHKVKIRIVYDKKTRVILGASLISTYDVSGIIHMFSLAIQEKVTIDKIKLLDIFFMPHFNEPYNYITMAALNAK